MSRRKRLSLSHIILIGWLLIIASRFEPLKTINEIYFTPWYLLAFFFFISFAAFFTIAFREGKIIRRKIIAERKKGA